MAQEDLTLLEIATHAEELFTKLRWPDGPVCPECGSHHYYKCADGKYKYKDCGKIFTIKTDSLFHGSHLPISYWLVALYLIVDGRGISSYQLAKKLGVTQKTAWYMQTRLRVCMDLDDVKLQGEIAMDEVYVGGTWRNFSLKRRNELLDKYKLPKAPKTVKEKLSIAEAVNSRYKTPVFGMNDGDQMVLKVVPNPIRQNDVIDLFKHHSLETGLAVSDCSTLYDHWKDFTGYELHTNNHSKAQFIADNGSSSNRIEGMFSWTKRGSVFNYVHMRKCYVQLYLNELCFRFNTRHLNNKEKLDLLLKKCSHKVDKSILRQLNEEEAKLSREENWFDPYEFFKDNPFIMDVCRGGVVYRREEFS